jgi:hypothetical protein
MCVCVLQVDESFCRRSVCPAFVRKWYLLGAELRVGGLEITAQ